MCTFVLSVSAKQVTMFYVPRVLRESTVCDVCDGECSDFCTNVAPKAQ